MDLTYHSQEHAIFNNRLRLIEEKVSKIDNRLWSILTLLIVNLGGIIGVLISTIL